MFSWSATEEDMEEIKKEALERLRPYLCEKLVADRHLDYLRSRMVLTRDDTEDISSRARSSKKTGRMLDYLAENPIGLDCLVESIRRLRTKEFVIGRIVSEVEQVKTERKEASRLSEASSSPVCRGETPFASHPSVATRYKNSSEADPSVCGDQWARKFTSVSMSSIDFPKGVSVSSVTSLPKPGEEGAPPVPPEEDLESSDLFQTLRTWSTPPI